MPSPRAADLARALGAAALLAGGILLLARLARREGAELWSRLSPVQMSERVQSFLSGVPRVEGRLRLVVATLDSEQSARGESRKSAFGLDLGTTKAALTVPVRVHYAVELGRPGAVEFQAEPASRTFTAIFPELEVQAVEVFSRDKRAVVEVGWARTRALSGRGLEDSLERGLYDSVRAEASKPPALALARPQARRALERLVADFLARGGAWGGERGFRALEVRFRGEDQIPTSSPRPDPRP